MFKLSSKSYFIGFICMGMMTGIASIYFLNTIFGPVRLHQWQTWFTIISATAGFMIMNYGVAPGYNPFKTELANYIYMGAGTVFITAICAATLFHFINP